MGEKPVAMSLCSPKKSRQDNEEISSRSRSCSSNSSSSSSSRVVVVEIAVEVVVREVSGEASGSIWVPKDTQILVIPLHLLTTFNGAKVL